MKLIHALSIKRFLISLGHALDGLKSIVKSEPNFIIHIIVGILVVILGLWIKLASWEWCAVIILIGIVLTMEAINTSIESLTDLVTKEKNPLAKRVKDTAAAAVLISSLTAIVIGLIIFLPKLLVQFNVLSLN